MIDPKYFLEALKEAGIDFVCGVPDSILKELLLVLQLEGRSSVEAGNLAHVIVASEGAAIALAAGYQMASGKLALVYMQNSGLGNAVNPLMSLVHKGVYAIPMLLLIGYRGEPGKPDERQHRAMGEATEALLSAMGIDTFALNAESDPTSTLQQAAACALAQSGPVAVLVSSSAFATAGVALHYESSLSITRQEVLNVLLDHLEGSEVVCSTTGYTSRELYDLRVSRSAVSAQKQADFLNVGAMGHVSQVALGIALARPDKKVIAIDGDGSLIMHMGSMVISGQSNAANFLHILINNGVHESVGGQPTAGFRIDFTAMALAAGYKNVASVCQLDSLTNFFNDRFLRSGPSFLEVKVRMGVKDKLGRPSNDFLASKEAFERHIRSGN